MNHVVLTRYDLVKVAEAACEAQARVVFDIATVGTLMKERASLGYGWMQVRQTKPMDLRQTRSAKKLLAWLAKCECRVDWREMPAREGDPMSRQYQHAELCIYWSKAFDTITVPADKMMRDVNPSDGS